MAISTTGYWDSETATLLHEHSAALAKFLIEYLEKDKDKPLYDFGCGIGYYLSELHNAGFTKLTGFEGAPLENKMFAHIRRQDLAQPFTLEEKGNCVCLEVLEHIPNEVSMVERITHLFQYGQIINKNPNEIAVNNGS